MRHCYNIWWNSAIIYWMRYIRYVVHTESDCWLCSRLTGARYLYRLSGRSNHGWRWIRGRDIKGWCVRLLVLFIAPNSSYRRKGYYMLWQEYNGDIGKGLLRHAASTRPYGNTRLYWKPRGIAKSGVGAVLAVPAIAKAAIPVRISIGRLSKAESYAARCVRGLL